MSKSILLVEDEAAIREMVHLALSRIGFETRTVADAVRAEREIEQERPDLILLDWMLPGVSGLELARGLRRRESTRDIPLIMLTAKGEESDRLSGFDAGADDYVVKPFSVKELVARICAVLKRTTPVGDDRPIEIDSLLLDPVSHRVSSRGETIRVGPTEFRMLHSWNLSQVHLLARWLASGRRDPAPDIRGIWALVFESLNRVHRQNRKRKKRLRKFVNRFQQAAEALPDGAIVLDDAGTILWMNAASGRLLGLELARDAGQPVSNFIRHPSFTNVLDAGTFDEPLEIPSPLHEEIHLLVRIVPYGGSRRLMIVRDVTRLHYLEQMRTDFVANVSHELRSPLTVVVGYLDAFRDDELLPAELRQPVVRMAQQASRMCRIVEDLLQLSRLEATPGTASGEQVAVVDMLDMIARDARSLGESTHRIVHESDSADCLLGDWNELYSAFSNVAFNAVQHTPPGGTIRLGWMSDGEGARVDVTDAGDGIEDHHIPRLTERFYRVDKARSHEKGGTGLGLAIVKHVLVRHDARLEVESRGGEGSRFSCRFPAHRVVRGGAPAETERKAVG